MMFRRTRELLDVIARWLPCRQRIQEEEALEDVAIREDRGLRRLLVLPCGCGPADLLQRGGSGGGRGVRGHPAPQQRRIAHCVAEFREIAVHNTVDVSIE